MSSPAADQPRRRGYLLRPWLPALAGALCFLNSLANGFTYDDQYIVRDNPRIRALGRPSAIWLSDWWQPYGRQALLPRPDRDRLYRPLTLYSFALNHALAGLRPLSYHAVNVALHALLCALVWQLAQRLFADAAVSTCAALLFAVHPVHCEAVANVVGRAELLSALFLLSGLLMLLPATGNAGAGRWLLAGAAFLLALLAKETALCYPALALLVLHATGRGIWRRRRRRLLHLALLLLPLAAYLPLRYAALEQRLLRPPLAYSLFNPLRNVTLAGRLSGALTVLGHYTRLLLLPRTLSCDYGLAIVDPRRGIEALTLLGAASAVLGAVLLAGYRRPAASLRRRLAVATALAGASYFLISNTVLLIGVSLAERLMYWPSVPALLLLALALVGLWRRWCVPRGPLYRLGGLLRVCGVLLLLALGLRSAVRNADWASNADLFLSDVATHPRGAHLNRSAAVELMLRAARLPEPARRRRLLAQAEQYLVRALRIHPRYPQALYDRGRLRAMLGDVKGARACAQSALLLDPYDTASRELLARLGGQARRKQARLALLLARIRKQPTQPAPRVEAGRLLIELGRPHEALPQLRRAAALAPDDSGALRLLGQALLLNHRPRQAAAVYRRVLSRAPDDWEARVNLARIVARSDPAASLAHARAAQRLRPTDLSANQALAEAYAANGQYDRALERFRYILTHFRLAGPFERALRDRVRELERRR